MRNSTFFENLVAADKFTFLATLEVGKVELGNYHYMETNMSNSN